MKRWVLRLIGRDQWLWLEDEGGAISWTYKPTPAEATRWSHRDGAKIFADMVLRTRGLAVTVERLNLEVEA
jgi:hypothetical protein